MGLLAQLTDLIALQHTEPGSSAFDYAKREQVNDPNLVLSVAISYLCQENQHQQQTDSLTLPAGLSKTSSTTIGGIQFRNANDQSEIQQLPRYNIR